MTMDELLTVDTSSLLLHQQLFLTSYIRLRKILESCYASQIGTHTFYKWLNEDENFKQAWQQLKRNINEQKLEELEAALHKRALEGISKGSDLLLMFALKAADPRKYQEKQQINIEQKTLDIKRVEIIMPGGVEQRRLPEAPKEIG